MQECRVPGSVLAILFSFMRGLTQCQWCECAVLPESVSAACPWVDRGTSHSSSPSAAQ